MTADALEGWLVARIAMALGVDEESIDPETPFAELGLGSLEAVEISGDLETLLVRKLDPTLLWEFPTARRLADHLGGAGA
jgi:acyl carrier protein